MCLSSICFAQTVFKSYSKHDTLSADKPSINYTYDDDGEKVTFQIDNQGYLHLYSKKSKEDYLSFIPYLGNQIGTIYQVREVHTESPKMTFYEIMSLNDKQNTGYWLIGKIDGKWSTYISYDSFVNMGLKTNVNHDIDSEIIDGSLYLIASNSDGKTDCAVVPFWDSKAKWFGLQSVTELFKAYESKTADFWIGGSYGSDSYIDGKKSYREGKYNYVHVKIIKNNQIVNEYVLRLYKDNDGTWWYNQHIPASERKFMIDSPKTDNPVRIMRDWVIKNLLRE